MTVIQYYFLTLSHRYPCASLFPNRHSAWNMTKIMSERSMCLLNNIEPPSGWMTSLLFPDARNTSCSERRIFYSFWWIPEWCGSRYFQSGWGKGLISPWLWNIATFKSNADWLVAFSIKCDTKSRHCYYLQSLNQPSNHVLSKGNPLEMCPWVQSLMIHIAIDRMLCRS